jgi:hypothetical protein
MLNLYRNIPALQKAIVCLICGCLVVGAAVNVWNLAHGWKPGMLHEVFSR